MAALMLQRAWVRTLAGVVGRANDTPMTNALTSSGLFGGYLADTEISGAFAGHRVLARMVEFERAWTLALIEAGVVTAAEGQAALDAIGTFKPSVADLGRAADRDGLPVPALVAALRAAAEPSGAAIHTGSTSQDVIDTALMLTFVDVSSALLLRLDDILGRLESLRDCFGHRQMMGRTRMQAARAIPVAARVDAWLRPVQASRAALEQWRVTKAAVQVGGAVGLRDFPDGRGSAVMAHVAATLGLSEASVWHTDRTRWVDLGHALVLISGALGKVGMDIVLLAQQGGDEISLATGGISSAMPHKKNPVAGEALVAVARYVAGQQAVLSQAMVHEQERSGTAWALEWLTLPAMAEACGASTLHGLALLQAVQGLGLESAPETPRGVRG